MVEHIEDPLFSGLCKSIKNWYQFKCTFLDAAATLCDREISNISDQNKIAIDDELNSLLLVKGSNKMRSTAENKALRAVKLGDPEEAKNL